MKKESASPRRHLVRATRLLVLAACVLPAMAQDAPRMLSGNYKIAFENDRMRVLDYNSRPGMGVCGQGMHSHPEHLTVVLDPGKVRIRLPDGRTMQTTSKKGNVFWSEAETHEVENISGRNQRALLIELKDAAQGRRTAAAP
jgi:hypothetical protein